MNIIFIYGMDASYLRFSKDKELGNEKDIFSTPYYSVLILSFVICLFILLLKNGIGNELAVPKNYSYLLILVSAILFTDSIAVLPFIKLRIERKAKKFALFKIIKYFN